VPVLHELLFEEGARQRSPIDRRLGSIIRHLPVIRRFLQEVCPDGDDDLGKFGLPAALWCAAAQPFFTCSHGNSTRRWLLVTSSPSKPGG